LDEAVASLITSESCLTTSALTSAAELILTCIFSSSDTSGVVQANFLFLPLDAVVATDVRDVNETTDSSSSDPARARDPPVATGSVASPRVTGARNTFSGLLEVLREELFVLLLEGPLFSSDTSILLVSIASPDAKTQTGA
jgi:hypothetical protein